MYEISFDAASRTLELRLEGFWSAATLARFKAELLVKVTACRLRYGRSAILSDSSRFSVQSAEIAEGFERMMIRGTNLHDGPTAIVVVSMLSKLQAERSLQGTSVRVFLDPAEARQWLAAQRNAG